MRLIALATMLAAALALAADDSHHAHHGKHAGHDVDQRGDKVMGFSHEKTRHTFRLLADGGAIEVRALDPNDAESVAAIRSHLKEIEKEFAAGKFDKPEQIHARVPDGVDVMTELRGAIRYQYEELAGGARLRIRSSDPRAIEAVHRFLRFQIADHRTGDPVDVE